MAAFVITLAALGIPLLLAIVSVWRGYALSVLWGWFMVPAFGAPSLSIPVAIGLSVVVGMLTHQRTSKDEQGFGVELFIAFATPVFALLIGWIAKSFM